MANVKRSFIDGKYGQIHLRTAGDNSDKTPIICLHMSPKSSHSYKAMMPFLAKDRLVIAPDYPGYGESDPSPEEPFIRIEDYAHSIWQVVDHFNLTTVDLVGHHTGSMVAVEATIQRPENVSKIVNIGAPVFEPEEVKQFEDLFSPIPLNVEGDRFRIMWERVMEYRGAGQTLEMASVSFAENLRGGEYYEWGHRAAFNYALQYIDNVPKIAQPFFAMNVNDDIYEMSRRVDTLINNGFRKDYPDLRVGFNDVAPKKAAEAIIQFLDTGKLDD